MHLTDIYLTIFVCDCSVSSGGKWYHELICLAHGKTSNTGLSNDYEDIVGVLMIQIQYMHRSRNIVARNNKIITIIMVTKLYCWCKIKFI